MVGLFLFEHDAIELIDHDATGVDVEHLFLIGVDAVSGQAASSFGSEHFQRRPQGCAVFLKKHAQIIGVFEFFDFFQSAIQSAVGVSVAQIGVVIAIDQQHGVKMVQRQTGFSEIQGNRGDVPADDALVHRPGFDKDKTEAFEHRGGYHHFRDRIHIRHSVFQDMLWIFRIVLAMQSHKITDSYGNGQMVFLYEISKVVGIFFF